MKHILAATTAALLLSAALPANAIDLGVGGVSVSVGSGSGGGTTASVGTGSTGVSATIGGGSNVASASAGTDGNTVNAGIGNTSGDLITTSSADGTTTANVNLGGLGQELPGLDGLPELDGLPGTDDVIGLIDDLLGTVGLPGGGGGGGGDPGTGGDLPGVIPPNQVAGAYSSLSGYDQALLRTRCQSVLLNPGGFDRNLIELCRLIRKLQMNGG